MITTWSPHRNAGCDCSRVPWYWMCLPPASPGGEQLHKPPNVEGQPTRSRDHSRTVIDLDLLPSSAMSWRGRAASLWRRQVNRQLLSVQTAAELARTRRCGETTGPKISASSGVATR